MAPESGAGEKRLPRSDRVSRAFSSVELEAAASEVSRTLRGRSEFWRQIKQDGIVVFGAGIDALAERAEDDAARR